MSASGSSESSGGGSGFGVAVGIGCCATAGLGLMGLVTGTGASSGAGFCVDVFVGEGVSSTVECLPVVHGGIARNSSKVRTRGLQHIHPAQRHQLSPVGKRKSMLCGRPNSALRLTSSWKHTFLSFMELRRSWMVDTIFFCVCEDFPAAFVYAFLCHTDRRGLCLVRCRKRLLGGVNYQLLWGRHC